MSGIFIPVALFSNISSKNGFNISSSAFSDNNFHIEKAGESIRTAEMSSVNICLLRLKAKFDE